LTDWKGFIWFDICVNRLTAPHDKALYLQTLETMSAQVLPSLARSQSVDSAASVLTLETNMSSTVLPRSLRHTWLILLGRLLMKMVRAHQRRRVTGALHQLPDHMLRDIGISRSQIDHAVEKGRFDEDR
jgi:uncharacterized protein YjiS (DUF1127 family)